MYEQRLRGHLLLISHPYSDSSTPPYLGTAILMILCFLYTYNQYNNVSLTPRCTPLWYQHKLRLVTFFSAKYFALKYNYKIYNKELLAIIKVLEK